MMLMWIIVKFYVALISRRSIFSSSERLPNPLEDQVYNKFMKCLHEGNLKISRDCDVITKKVYRLYKTQRYRIKKMKDPITGENKEFIVSKYQI